MQSLSAGYLFVYFVVVVVVVVVVVAIVVNFQFATKKLPYEY